MDAENLETSLKAIEYSREAQASEADECAIRNLLESVVCRKKGELERAKELLALVLETPLSKGVLHDEWMGEFCI